MLVSPMSIIPICLSITLCFCVFVCATYKYIHIYIHFNWTRSRSLSNTQVLSLVGHWLPSGNGGSWSGPPHHVWLNKTSSLLHHQEKASGEGWVLFNRAHEQPPTPSEPRLVTKHKQTVLCYRSLFCFTQVKVQMLQWKYTFNAFDWLI